MVYLSHIVVIFVSLQPLFFIRICPCLYLLSFLSFYGSFIPFLSYIHLLSVHFTFICSCIVLFCFFVLSRASRHVQSSIHTYLNKWINTYLHSHNVEMSLIIPTHAWPQLNTFKKIQIVNLFRDLNVTSVKISYDISSSYERTLRITHWTPPVKMSV